MSAGLRAGTNNDGYLQINGTDVLTVLSSGRIGVGTTNPSTTLHIVQPSDFNGITISHVNRPGIWRLEHSGTSSENFAFYQNNGVSAVPTYVAGRSQHIWYTDNNEKMQIVSNGNVGIGTTNPSSKLHVNGGNIQVTSGNIQVTGGVGIGTSPAFKLDVYDSLADASGRFKSNFGSEISLDAGNAYASLRIFSSGTEKWRVGHVGDSTVLDIFQSGQGARLRFGDSGNTVWYTRTDYDASQYLFLQQNSVAFGRVGLTIRGKTHDVNGVASANDGWHWNSGRSIIRYQSLMNGDTDWDTKFGIQHLMGQSSNASVGDLGILSKGFAGGTTPAVVVNANGNVGIGTTNASTKFHVAGGNIKVDNGYGIDFSSTANSSGTVNSEVLSDFEHGTWTPIIYLGDTAQSYNIDAKGNYTKIGDLIQIGFWIGFGAYGQTNFPVSSTAVFGIGGLPFYVGVYQNTNMGTSRTQNGLFANAAISIYQRNSIINFANTTGNFGSWLVNEGLKANQISSQENVIITGQLIVNNNAWG